MDQLTGACDNCGKAIVAREGERACDAKKRRFCNRSCASSFNNRKHPKRVGGIGTCQSCGETIYYKRCPSGSFSRRKFCDECLPLKRSGGKLLEGKTKGALKESSNFWVEWRTSISKNARRTYMRAGKSLKCVICGYDHHVDICCIEPVSSFAEDATIDQINSLSNLIGLCPNHHWDLDHGLLDLNEILTRPKGEAHPS